MAVDDRILREFRQAMKQIYKQLSPLEFLQVVKDKIVDYINRNPKADPVELKQAINEIFKPEMAKWMTDVNKTYNDVIDVVNSAYSGLAGDMRRELVKLQRIEKLNTLKFKTYSERTISHISTSLVTSFKDELTYQETVSLLEREKEIAAHEAHTIATTGMRGYARAAKNEKANLAEVFYYEYVGPLRLLSRDFCKTMIGKTLHITEINKLKESEVGPAFISPCIIFCGGWNCGHDWEPDPFFDIKNSVRKLILVNKRPIYIYSKAA